MERKPSTPGQEPARAMPGEKWAPANFAPASTNVAGLFDTIFQEVDEAIVLLECSGPKSPPAAAPLIVDVNRTFVNWTGYSRDEVLGHSFYSLLDCSNADVRSVMDEAMAARRNVAINALIVAQSNECLPVHITLKPVFSGALRRFTIVMRRAELAASHAAELASRERDLALRAKEELLARVGHELRTPLNGILGLSEILKSGMLGDIGQQRYRDYAQDIHLAGTKLLWRIEELLHLKKVEDRHWTPEDQPLDPGLVVTECIGVLQPLAAERDVTIEHRPGRVPSLIADKSAFRRLVLGIVGSAIGAAPPSSEIAVILTLARNGEMRLETHFQGEAQAIVESLEAAMEAGLSEMACTEDTNGEWAPPGPETSVYNRADVGNVVGLYLARRIVERHGGTLSIQACAAGKTAVEVAFPAHRVGWQ